MKTATTAQLLRKTCQPCEGGVPPIPVSEAKGMLSAVPGWSVEESKGPARLYRRYKFKDDKRPLEFAKNIWKIAMAENHHPDVRFGWGYVEVETWTHAIGGLSENDFILAAKINELAD